MSEKLDITTEQVIWWIVKDTIAKGIRLDNSTESLITVSYEHHELHDWTHYMYSNCIELQNWISQDYLITTPNTNKWIHLIFEIYWTTQTDIAIFEETDKVWTTLQSFYNNNRNILNTSEITIHKWTTWWTTDWINIHPDCFWTSLTGGKWWLSIRDREIILKQNTKYIIRITSGSNSNRIWFHLDWYEHTNRN